MKHLPQLTILVRDVTDLERFTVFLADPRAAYAMWMEEAAFLADYPNTLKTYTHRDTN